MAWSRRHDRRTARFLRKPFVAVARVVDQYVDQADLALHLVHRGRDRVLIAHVEEDAVRTTGDIGRERGAGLKQKDA